MTSDNKIKKDKKEKQWTFVIHIIAHALSLIGTFASIASLFVQKAAVAAALAAAAFYFVQKYVTLVAKFVFSYLGVSLLILLFIFIGISFYIIRSRFLFQYGVAEIVVAIGTMYL